jgi:hypothetical protein
MTGVIMPDDLPYSVPLVFTRSPSGHKVYAPTPAGEYAYSDSQGLYEWRRVFSTAFDDRGLPVPDFMIRIDYSGGDRQASDRDGFWSRGSSGSLQARDIAWPAELGFCAALDPRRLN